MFRDKDRFEITVVDVWAQHRTFGAILLHLPFQHEGHSNEILYTLNRLSVAGIPENDHALCDFVRRGLDFPEEPNPGTAAPG